MAMLGSAVWVLLTESAHYVYQDSFNVDPNKDSLYVYSEEI